MIQYDITEAIYYNRDDNLHRVNNVQKICTHLFHGYLIKKLKYCTQYVLKGREQLVFFTVYPNTNQFYFTFKDTFVVSTVIENKVSLNVYLQTSAITSAKLEQSTV